jgi:hypothetical protein
MVTVMQAAMNASTRVAAAIADFFIKKEIPWWSGNFTVGKDAFEHRGESCA